jgi:hypothetical protein
LKLLEVFDMHPEKQTKPGMHRPKEHYADSLQPSNTGLFLISGPAQPTYSSGVAIILRVPRRGTNGEGQIRKTEF